MNVAELSRQDVVTVRTSDEVLTAAQRMREKHVGYLVVLDHKEPETSRRPVGVITDRDIVITVVARAVDPASVCVGDIMTRTPITAGASDAPEQAVRIMRRHGVRRLPVVNAQGQLVGIVALDDLLDFLAGELQSVAGAIRHEQHVERQLRA